MRGRRTHPTLPFFIPTAIALLVVSFCATANGAQEKPNSKDATPVTTTNELTIDSVQARLKKVEDNKELDAAIKTKLVETYTKTLEQLRAVAESVGKSEQNGKLTKDAPAALQSLKAELATPMATQPPDIPKDATFAQVQQLLSQAEMALSDAQKSLQALQDEPKRRADRRLEIPKLADAAKLQLQELDKQLEAKPPADELAEVSVANRWLLESRKKTITAETAASQVELQFFDATSELLSAQRDQAARRVAEADEQVKALRAIVNERRRQEAEKQALEARKTSAQAQPVVRKIADANAELAKQRQSLAGKIEGTTRDWEQLDRQLTALEEQFKKITKRYDTAGATEAIGLLLRKQRDELPDVATYQRKIKQRTAEISGTYLELIDFEEKRNDLATLEPHVSEALRNLGSGVEESERGYLEEEVRHVLEAQRSLYDSLIADTNSLLDKLVELDVRQRQLLAKSNEYADYCDERILWIRSTTVLDTSHLRQLAPSLLWLVNPNGWREVGAALWSDVLGHPLLTALAALLFIILILVQRPLRTTMNQLGEQAARSNIVSYLPTLRAFLTTGLLSLLWPGLLGYVGLRLIAAESGSEFVSAIGHGLKQTAIVFGTLELFRHVCRRRGLGESHFDWDENTMRLARWMMWWFLACGLPLILVVTITESQPSELIKNSLGRLAFVGSLLVLTACIHRVMRPVGGALDAVYNSAPQAWTTRMQRVWHLLALSAPLMLGALALSGFYYTSLQLAWRLLATWWVVIGLMILHAALIRWSLLSYRDLAMRKARERRSAETAASAGGTSPSAASVGKVQPEVKLSDINKQTRKILQLGLVIGLIAGAWLVWVDMLPALGALRYIELWTVETTSATGGTGTVLQAITLANVLLAIVISVLTFAAGRNLPGLLEITLLQRLPLEPGVRYAITTICKYAITAVGLVSAFGAIGIGWSKVQWLVAAVSVGLGFGLQEIFANFVSGLILLFERPVRLGDIVTVGDVTGHVTRIQMRATTITDWDMRELVVPNKEFITSRVMNWTLSSTVSRMSIEVGVAYGTNPDLVRNLLMQIATRHPLVLKEPAPHALFDQFADSTLNFVLRVYMTSRDVYLQLRHELLTEIAREFQQANIEIAFPQRDIHVRSIASQWPSLDQSTAAAQTKETADSTGSSEGKGSP